MDYISQFEFILAECDIGPAQAAIAMGASPSTVTVALTTRRLPERQDARLKFIRWVDANRGATCRRDLRFV